MATLTIPDSDDAVVEKLRDFAEEHNHSIEAQIRDLLQQATEAKPRSKLVLEIANAIAAQTAEGLPQMDSVILLREDRDR